MIVLQDYQFELGGVVFGLDAPVFTRDTGFKPSGRNVRTQDVDNPVGDGGRPGRSFHGPETYAFDLATIADRPAEGLDDLAVLERAWGARELRNDPGRVTSLRYALPGRRRVLFGQPRRWTPSIDNSLINGHVGATADFTALDPLIYADELQSLPIGIRSPNSARGFRMPVRFPARTQGDPGASFTSRITVGGTEPAPVEIRIVGPVLDPVVEVVGCWRVGVRGSVESYDPLTLAGQLNFRRAVTDSGISMRGKLTGGVNLASLVVPPGSYDVRFIGIDPTGAATATVSWRDAYATL